MAVMGGMGGQGPPKTFQDAKRRNLGAPGPQMGMPGAQTGMPGAEQGMPDVGYMEVPGGPHCGNCQYLQPDGSCPVVQQQVNPTDGWCKAWTDANPMDASQSLQGPPPGPGPSGLPPGGPGPSGPPSGPPPGRGPL